MADQQQTSQVVGQVEYDISDPVQIVSQIVGQVEYVDTDDIPPAPKGISISVIT